MKTCSFVLLFYLFKLTFNINIYKPKIIFSYFQKEKISSKDSKNIIDKLSNIFKELYAFNEIAKNPPNFNYKVDIQEEFKKIDTSKERPFYEFHQDIMRILGKLKDGHTTLVFNKFNLFNESIVFCNPIKLEIRKNNKGNFSVYGKLYLNKTYMDEFRNNETIQKIVNSSLNVPIKSINGMDPFDFIDSFGDEFLNIRNPHGAFTFRYNIINRILLGFCPLSLDKLLNFTVVYENGKKFDTDYILITKNNITQNKTTKNANSFLHYDIDITNEENELNDFTFIPEITDFPYELFNLNNFGLKEFKKENKIETLKNTSLKWDYNLSDIFKCRVDSNFKVNVYYIKSFMPNASEYTKYFEAISNCSKLFDKNDNKVVVILNMNGGGSVMHSHLLLEIISPLLNINLYTALRKTETLNKYYYQPFYTSDKCEPMSFREFFQNNTKVMYGDSITDILTAPSILNGKNERQLINSYKFKLKNKRKPTDILVYTDGYSFSAAGMFLKYLQHYGGGIVVGYFGNPKKEKEVFDSGLSPSSIIDSQSLNNLSPNDFKQLNKDYKLEMQFASGQFFYDPYNLSVPLEYDITPVDIRVPIYENFTDSNYDLFIKTAIDILNNYTKICNSKNKRLFLKTDECNNISNKSKETHGGYICGDDGKWNKTCVPTYCDKNYILDPIKKECVFDYCTIPEGLTIIFIILGCILLSIIIIIVFVIYLLIRACFFRKRMKTKIYNHNDRMYNINEIDYYRNRDTLL